MNRIFATLGFAFLASSSILAGDLPEPSNSFHYSLVGIAKSDGISYACLFDPQTGDHFLLSTVTHPEHGFVLASVQTDDDPTGPSAIIQKDGTSVLLKLEGGVTQAPLSLVHSAPNSSSSGPAGAGNLKPPAGATLPLIFQEIDPKKMTLTDEQKATLNQLRQEFIGAIGGTGSGSVSQTPGPSVNANSPDAVSQNAASSDQQLQNWTSAQRQSDEHFRMLYGTQAFLAYQESISYPTSP